MANGLGEIPDSLDQDRVKQSCAVFVAGESLVDMIFEDLMTNRISCNVCRQIIHYLKHQDEYTSNRLQAILAMKEQRTGILEYRTFDNNQRERT